MSDLDPVLRSRLIEEGADTLRDHWPTWDFRAERWRCGCGHVYADLLEPPLHQAAAVVDALGIATSEQSEDIAAPDPDHFQWVPLFRIRAAEDPSA